MPWLILTIALIISPLTSLALEFPLPASNDAVIGHIEYTKVQPGENFNNIARKYNIGYYELVEANPSVNPNAPAPGTLLIIPSQYVLPPGPRKGAIINLAELRIYFFPKDEDKVYTFPISIGRQGWGTPTGEFHIVEKMPHPKWVPPDDIKEEYFKETGSRLPDVVEPGPDNPLGDYAMRLSNPLYLIHGTNNPSGIGRRASSGCIRMNPEDISHLFQLMHIDTPVRIINEPYKAGWHRGHLFFEAHLPLQEQQLEWFGSLDPARDVLRQAQDKKPSTKIDWSKAMQVARLEMGIPIVVNSRSQSEP